MADASESGEKAPRIRVPPLDSKTAMSLGLVVTLCVVVFAYGQSVGKSKVLDDENEKKFAAIQGQVKEEVERTSTETNRKIDNQASETNSKIDNLKTAMEIRAASRDKEIDAINKRLGNHDDSLHELLMLITKRAP